MTVTVPPGLDASGPVLVADKVTASESWSPDPASAGIRAGAAAASGDAAGTYHALAAWLDCLAPVAADSVRADPRTRQLIERLERAHRARWTSRTRANPLPPLNPAFPG